MNDTALQRFEALHSRPCPRVLLDHENEDAAELLQLLADNSPAFAGQFDDLTEAWSADERVALRRRLLAVRADQSYQDARAEAMARLRREQEEAAGARR